MLPPAPCHTSGLQIEAGLVGHVYWIWTFPGGVPLLSGVRLAGFTWLHLLTAATDSSSGRTMTHPAGSFFSTLTGRVRARGGRRGAAVTCSKKDMELSDLGYKHDNLEIPAGESDTQAADSVTVWQTHFKDSGRGCRLQEKME